MSVFEIKDYCERISPYGLTVKVRLKRHSDIIVGKIKQINGLDLVLQPDDADAISVQYNLVASITHG